MPADTPAFALPFSSDALRPLIKAVVAETLAEVEKDRERIPADRLAFTEAEAAAMLGLKVHNLRDERTAGRIVASKILGGRVRYQRADILTYLNERRVSA